jgi:hypothetical protein
MTDTNENVGPRDRSPAFPVVPLEAAIGKLTEFEAHFKRTAARPEKVGEAWNIKTKAYVDRIAAALRYFGLLEYQGTGKERGIIVSEEGRKYLRAHQDETKQEVIKAAALRPKQIAKFWSEWGRDRPADAACMDLLIQKHGFSDSGARDFLKVYDATIAYAKLSDSDKVPSGSHEDDDELGKPPMQQVAPETPVKPHATPVTRQMTMHEKFALDEGEVSLSFPAELSEESLKDLEDRFEIILRGAKRRAAAASNLRTLTGSNDEAAN